MAHAIGLAAAVCATACAPTPIATGSLGDLQSQWFYVPGPYTTVRSTRDGDQPTRVTAERNGRWTVTIGEPPTTIAVVRLPDGRPATTSISNPDRNETAVFEPPLPLMPAAGQTPPAVEESDVALYEGLSPAADARPSRTGTASRTFFAIEPTTWTIDGNTVPAQRMTHVLLLDFGAAKVRQRYESTAVENRGVVRETMRERITFLGVRVDGREEQFEVIEFIDER
ncbi:MAG: hypothetical protein RIE32_04625 [Phycisphaerales bacterium]